MKVICPYCGGDVSRDGTRNSDCLKCDVCYRLFLPLYAPDRIDFTSKDGKEVACELRLSGARTCGTLMEVLNYEELYDALELLEVDDEFGEAR